MEKFRSVSIWEGTLYYYYYPWTLGLLWALKCRKSLKTVPYPIQRSLCKKNLRSLFILIGKSTGRKSLVYHERTLVYPWISFFKKRRHIPLSPPAPKRKKKGILHLFFFWPENYDFDLYKGFFMEKIAQIC